MSYPFREIEKKWQERWEKEEAYLTKEDCSSPKFYVLDMFPYPSGQGLHVGHLKGYVATDIIARWKRTEGFNVLHPMGWDAFGLPAENYAIKTGIHPETTTKNNIANIKRQMKMWDLVMTGQEKLILLIRIITSGRNGFSFSFSKRAWLTKSFCLLTGVLPAKPDWLMKKWLTANAKDAEQKLPRKILSNGF